MVEEEFRASKPKLQGKDIHSRRVHHVSCSNRSISKQPRKKKGGIDAASSETCHLDASDFFKKEDVREGETIERRRKRNNEKSEARGRQPIE